MLQSKDTKPAESITIPSAHYQALRAFLAQDSEANIDTSVHTNSFTLSVRYVDQPNTVAHTQTTIGHPPQNVISDSQIGELILSRSSPRFPVSFYQKSFRLTDINLPTFTSICNIYPRTYISFTINFELAALLFEPPFEQRTDYNYFYRYGLVLNNRLAFGFSPSKLHTLKNSRPVSITQSEPPLDYYSIKVISYTLSKNTDIVLLTVSSSSLVTFSRGDRVILSAFNSLPITANDQDIPFFLNQEYEVILAVEVSNNSTTTIAIRGRLYRSLETVYNSTTLISSENPLFLNKIIKYSLEFTQTRANDTNIEYNIALYDQSNGILLHLERNIDLRSEERESEEEFQLNLVLYSRAIDVYLRTLPSISSNFATPSQERKLSKMLQIPIINRVPQDTTLPIDYLDLNYILKRNQLAHSDISICCCTTTNSNSNSNSNSSIFLLDHNNNEVIVREEHPVLLNSTSDIKLNLARYTPNDIFEVFSLKEPSIIWKLYRKDNRLVISDATVEKPTLELLSVNNNQEVLQEQIEQVLNSLQQIANDNIISLENSLAHTLLDSTTQDLIMRERKAQVLDLRRLINNLH